MTLTLIPELHRATHRVALYLEEAAPGISQGEAHLLAYLHQAIACRVGELHRAFGHKGSTLTSLVDRLQQRGWVTRERAPNDRRSYVIRTTRAGKAAAARVFAALVGLELAATRRLTRAEVDGFLAVAAAIGAVDR